MNLKRSLSQTDLNFSPKCCSLHEEPKHQTQYLEQRQFQHSISDSTPNEYSTLKIDGMLALASVTALASTPGTEDLL